MNDLDELKRYITVHARGQRIPDLPALLDRIRTDAGDEPGSWVREWSDRGDRLERDGKPLDAARHFAMARFPYVDGPARAGALRRCVAAFDRWRADGQGIERLDLDLDGGRVGCWSAGLDAADSRPLLLVLGGIVSVKEQWAPTLPLFAKLGFAAVGTELPGAGENTLRYGPESWRMLPDLLDRLAGRADVSRTYAIAFSFAGHLALRAAAEDPRLAGIVTAGAPVREFFTDQAWQARVPDVTMDTLAHLTGTKRAELVAGLDGWALSDAQLAAVGIPVAYLASRRDEIIPPAEAARLPGRLKRLHLIENDDTHGSPRHVVSSQLWTLASLLRLRGDRGPRRALVGGLARAARLADRLRPGRD